MGLDLSDLPVVDVHCHPFTPKPDLSAEAFTDVTAFGGGSAAYFEEAGIAADETVRAELQSVKRETLYFRHMMHRLADLLGCAPNAEAVAQARTQAISAEGYAQYVKRVLRAGNIAALITDFGYPLPPVPVEQFRADTGVQIVPIYRIEPLIVELLKEDTAWPEFKRRYDEAISAALTSDGYRGLKSVIAYRTGLDISPLARSADFGLQALDAIRRGTDAAAGSGRISASPIKKLRDHLLCRALELCIEHDVPMQIHTGMGDWQVQLSEARPALLYDLLRFPPFRACRVLLVHTGYPFHAEAGYMANVLPRVWCDISEGTPFAGNAARRIIAEVLEMAPLNRVCYGSDAYGTVEPFYASALLGRRSLAQVLEGLAEDGMLSTDEARAAAPRILSENARELYKMF